MRLRLQSNVNKAKRLSTYIWTKWTFLRFYGNQLASSAHGQAKDGIPARIDAARKVFSNSRRQISFKIKSPHNLKRSLTSDCWIPAEAAFCKFPMDAFSRLFTFTEFVPIPWIHAKLILQGPRLEKFRFVSPFYARSFNS